jgi:hypothetical protein
MDLTPTVSFLNSTRKAFIIFIGNAALYFSYTQLIGIATQEHRVRVKNSWGPTTGKHFNQFNIGQYEIVTHDELHKIVNKQLMKDSFNQFNLYLREGNNNDSS